MTRLKTLAAAALAASLIPSGVAFAQNPSAETRAELMTPTPPPALDNLDIDFPGGTLREYLRHLQDRAGVNNIVIRSEGIGEIEMPEVKLSGVHFADAIQLIVSLLDSEERSNLTISPVGANRSIYVVYFREPRTQPTNTYRSAVSVDFPGGSLTEFVQYLQEKSGARGILLRGPSDRFEIKPIEFESVQVLSILSAYSGAEQVLDSGDRLRLNVEIREALLLVEVQADTRMTDFQRKPARTASWSLAAMRGPGRLSTEDMLTAIEAAVEVSGAADTAKIRFHDETSLLIVSARTDALEIIDGALEQLSRSVASSAAAKQEAIELRSRLTSEAMIARSRMDYFTELLDFEEKRLERLQVSYESGSISEEGVHEQRLVVLEARASQQEAEARLEEVEARLARAQSQLEAIE